MKHVVKFFMAIVFCAIATFMLYANVKALPTAPILLGTIVALYVVAMTLAFPTRMAVVRDELQKWYLDYKADTDDHHT